MPKEKTVPPNFQPDNSSDDYDSSYSGPRAKEKIKKILTPAADSFYSKSKITASAKKRRATEDEGGNSGTSTDSELEYKSNLKTTKSENEFSKKNKIKKRKRDVSDDSDSGENNVNVNTSLVEKVAKNVSNKPRKKLKKEKEKIFNNRDLLKYLNKSNNMTNKNDSLSDEDQLNADKYVSLSDIKKELLSNDSETDSEANTKNDNISVNNIVADYAIKNELQSHCSSDSEVEDDASTEFSTKHSSTNNSVKILQHIRLTPKSKTSSERLREHFHDLQPKSIIADFELSDSEEVSILRIPKNVNLQLKNVEIDPENKCKIKLEEKYIMTPTISIPEPNYIVCTNSRVVQFKNNIKMEKYIKSRSEPNVMVQEKKLMPLPENLKERHPLFGSDFQQKIRLSEQVEKKLDDAIANLLKREKRAKKKKNKKGKPEPRAEENQEIFNLLNSHSFLTNNDRIKKETSDDSAFGSSSSTDNIGKKKQKAQTSEKYVKPKLELVALKEAVVKSSKKKKLKTSYDWSNNNSGIKKEIQDADTVDYKESSTSLKWKKKRSIINSTLMSDIMGTPQFNPELSTIVSDASVSGKKSKKYKKDKTPSDIQNETFMSELLTDVTMKIKVPKTIKEEA